MGLGLAIAACLLGGVYLYRSFVGLGRFLSLSRPVAASMLVVEGWLPDSALVQASKLFWQQGYRCILTTGPPLAQGSFLSQYQTQAQLAAATLIALGIPDELVHPLPCPTVTTGRTYTSALAVKEYLAQTYPDLASLNLFTYGCHARRSGYIYRRLFRPAGVAVGVIASAVHGFELDRWWQTSSGVRTVLGEWIAYLYVRLIRWDR
ncbi:MAG TPA: YdcF family protein [Leptolyngbyaceae cyanobacterium M65_K2018_010]|nr:YdcF family protein [Leptolyngbyaceae cyanobacterium M65_K2018_010]